MMLPCRLISPLTAEKHLPTIISPLEDVEPPCDVVVLAHKALSATKLATALLSEALPSLSTRLLERRAKNRRAPKPNSLDSEVYVPQKTNAKKKMRQGFDTNDALQLFLWGPETKQLLTAKEEAELITHIQHLIKLEKVKTKLESQNGCEPTISEWPEAMGVNAKQYQNRGLNFQDLLQAPPIDMEPSQLVDDKARTGNYRPSKEQLASHVGVSKEKLDKLLYNTRTPLSMQQPIWSDQDTTFQESPQRTESKGEKDHQAEIWDWWWETETVVGDRRDLWTVRVRLLESRALLYKLKQNMNSHGLSAYADFLV
ncbi:hypothetical protein IGI04_010479 [Brassica rapa subsp. trilocularis]|uniref:RNA polymerase sigma-70 region 3 domain-containing protein n=1 Tax=Brassica rapa subsp. trilocularis TaxID=1813537 RepID=A0ABQ7N0D1_BRACM|nr:hypothetical protein IGI04_010479 [Brassica rapa subsp. trilocularis]